jgi:hypothetical protein
VVRLRKEPWVFERIGEEEMINLGMGVVIVLIALNAFSVIHGLVKAEGFRLFSFINLLFWIFLGLPLAYGG